MTSFPITDPTNLRIADLLSRAAALHPERDAVICDDQRLTWTDLFDRTETAARAFLAAGVRRGDRVSLWMENRTEWVVAYYALARVGAVVVPINTRLRPAEVSFILGHAQCERVVMGETCHGADQMELVSAVRTELGEQRLQVMSPGDGSGVDIAFQDFDALAAIVDDGEFARHVDAVVPGDLALLLYTSGTTGMPKGVMHSHKVVRNMKDLATRMRFDESDRMLLYLPLFHVFANFAGLLATAWSGAASVLMQSFDPQASLALIERERVTIALGVPTTYHDQLRAAQENRYDVSSLRLCFAPGAPHDTRAVDAAFATAVNLYGMTETTSTTSISGPEDSLEHRSETVGRPLPGSEVRIVDELGGGLAPGETGEIAVRGHPVMLGYYRDADATADVLDVDGWFRTGDLGALDHEGYLTFVGRKRDMVKVGGENVDPIEIEVALMAHPDVDLAAVIGVPDERLTEVVCAYVTSQPGATAKAEDLIELLRPCLAPFKMPRYVRVVESLPVTATGKIQKARLQEQFRNE